MARAKAPGSREPSPPVSAASGFDPSRDAILRAAHDIQALAKERPDLFRTRYRAIGLRDRCGWWLFAGLIATVVSWATTGTAHYPVELLAGMIFAAVLIYFDPPKIRTISVLRDSDRSPAGGDSATGSVHEGAARRDRPTPSRSTIAGE